MIDFTFFNDIFVIYLVFIAIITGASIYATNSYTFGLIPPVAFTVFLSITGFLPLWIFYIMLILVVIMFTYVVFIPLLVADGGGANG